MLLRVSAVCASLLLVPGAWAINRCVGPEGRVSFQDAPCPGAGGEITVRPATGWPAPPAPKAAVAGNGAGDAPAQKKEIPYEDWARRTYLQNRGLPDAAAAIAAHNAQCDRQQQEIAGRKALAKNNLAGATLEQSISAEMQAAATVCASRLVSLTGQRDALERELAQLLERERAVAR